MGLPQLAARFDIECVHFVVVSAPNQPRARRDPDFSGADIASAPVDGSEIVAFP